MDGSNVSAKSDQKESGFECNVQVQYRGCTIHDTGKNHRHFGGPVPLRMGLFLVHISVL